MILVVQSPAEEGCGNDELVNCLLSADYCPPEEYMSFEFGPKSALNYPKRCADICIRHKAVSGALAERIPLERASLQKQNGQISAS